jgi:ABC-type sugar transport system substrate-binding protein
VGLGGDGVGVEGDEGVFGADGAEGVVEGEEAGEVIGVCDEDSVDWGELAEEAWELCLRKLTSVRVYGALAVSHGEGLGGKS